jgi:hypothetical protein
MQLYVYSGRIMNVSAVMPKDYNLVWNQISNYMEGAAKYTYGRFDVEDIKDGLYKNNWQLWIAFDSNKIYGAVITEVMEYPRLNALVLHFTGGVRLKLWKDDMLALLRRFASDRGCKTIESHGRAGWKKVFENDGYKSKFMFYELPVEDYKND